MGSITFKGQSLTLASTLPAPGTKAPDFSLLANDLSLRALKDYTGKILIILTVPSLDTPVCDVEVRRFNKEAVFLSDKVRILAVSCDLPFAQVRWCGAAGIAAVESLSDHRDVSFGQKYGILIRDLRLLARSVFVIDASGFVSYVQLVPELSQEPDYVAALAAAEAAARAV